MVITNLDHFEITEANKLEGGAATSSTTTFAFGLLPSAGSSSIAVQTPLFNLAASGGGAGALIGIVGTSSTAVAG